MRVLLALLFSLSLLSKGYAQNFTNTDFVSLEQIKADTDNDGRTELIGDTVRVGGRATIATGKLNERYFQIFIQSDSTGLSLFSTTIEEEVSVGDSLVAVGVVQEYYGLTELNVLNYSVLPGSGQEFTVIPLSKISQNLSRYEGLLVSGQGTIVGKGNQFNGKYLMIAPENDPDSSIMAYVTNFHTDYEDFDFEALSIGDEVDVTGILSLYSQEAESETGAKPTFKLHLRSPDDLSLVGLSQNQVILWGSIGILVLAIVIGWIISLRSTVKSQTKDLEKSLEDKEMLLKEIHHRVKNNLAIMSGLFGLQLNYTDHEATIRMLRDSQSRLKSMALVHDKLYKTKHFGEVEMADYIGDMVTDLHSTLKKPTQDISINFELNPVKLHIDRAIPCGLLINEIVVNAFKHAFDESREQGTLCISLMNDGEVIKLEIADDGIGIPDAVQMNSKNSLGLILIQTFRKQIQAQMEVSNEGGTRYSFTIPINSRKSK